jgi:uncharacterized protein YggE
MTQVAVAAVLALGTLAVPGMAQASQASRADQVDQVSVSGEGSVPVKPDIMLVRAGVEVRGAQPGIAYQATETAATKLIGILRGSGVAEKDIKTTDLSVQPEYVPDHYPKIAGYRGSENVSATVRKLDTAPATLNAVMAGGPEVRLDGITFDKADWSVEQDAAQELAFKDAHAKAERYAKLAGRKLGRLLSASAETVDPIPPHIYPKEAIMASGGNISPGEGASHVTVHLIYALA